MAESADQVIIAQAAANHAVCTRAQLVQRGVSDGAIRRRVANGLLEVVGSGVYVVVALRSRLTPLGAGLAIVSGSAVARQSAASLHGFPVPDRSLHLVGTNGANSRIPSVRLHQTRYLPSFHVQTRRGMPVTSPARTLCDLAQTFSARRIRYLVEEQMAVGNPTLDELAACHLQLARRGRAGTVSMRTVLGPLLREAPVVDSRLELLLQRALKSSGIELIPHYRPDWYDGISGIVDLAEPIGRTIVESDGRSFHATSEAFDNDRRRDRTAASHGWVVLRIGWRDVTGGQNGPIEELINILRQRLEAAT